MLTAHRLTKEYGVIVDVGEIVGVQVGLGVKVDRRVGVCEGVGVKVETC